MNTLVDIFKKIGALLTALIYFILFVFVLGIDFCTFGAIYLSLFVKFKRIYLISLIRIRLIICGF